MNEPQRTYSPAGLVRYAGRMGASCGARYRLVLLGGFVSTEIGCGSASVASGRDASQLQDVSPAEIDGRGASDGPGREAGAGRDGSAGAPNLVVILADDMGFGDMGAYGKLFGTKSPAPTPHMDRLATEDVMFTQAYSS